MLEDDEEIIDDEIVEEISLQQCAEAAKACNSMEGSWKKYRDEFKRAEEMKWLIHICGHIQYERELSFLPYCVCPFEVECLAKTMTERFRLRTSAHSCSKCKAHIGSTCCGLADQYGISPMSPMECRDCDPEWAQNNIGKDYGATVKKVPTIEEEEAPTQPVKNNNNNSSEEINVEENNTSFSSQGSCYNII